VFRPTSGFKISSSSELKRLKNPFGRKPAVRQAAAFQEFHSSERLTVICTTHKELLQDGVRATQPQAQAGDNTDVAYCKKHWIESEGGFLNAQE
jgi:hypothetical protein